MPRKKQISEGTYLAITRKDLPLSLDLNDGIAPFVKLTGQFWLLLLFYIYVYSEQHVQVSESGKSLINPGFSQRPCG